MNTATATAIAPFAMGHSYQHAADILETASAVTRFLYEIAPVLAEGKADCGISEKGAYGLLLILEALERTIDAATAAL